MRFALLLLPLTMALAACGQTPRLVASVPCVVAPRIDGVVGADEWPETGRLAWSMAMAGTGGPSAPRPAVLWAQNSATNLYIAFRVPDAQRQLDLAEPVADLVLLAFCAGANLAQGDDRRMLLPGAHLDKHFVAPGRDADDTVRHGAGVLRWHPGDGGFYEGEWQIPLDSGDGQDLRAKPGERIKMNLVYADGFRPGGQGMEVGGLFGANGDDAGGWGEIVMAKDVSTEQAAPVPAAIAALFPHVGEPDHLAHRLRRLDWRDVEVGDTLGAVVTVELEYPRLDGQPERAQACVYLPPALLADPGAARPLVHAAGYELDEGSAAGLLREGVIVATPHAHAMNPLSRGPNLDLALLHAMRAMPWVDGRRILIQGGSAGGWTTLMMAAESFPLVGAMPAVPPIDFGYNAAYIASQGATGAEAGDPAQSKTPVLAAVRAIIDQLGTYLNVPYEADAYRALMPAATVATITAPTQVYFTTADMLVPIDQVAPRYVRPRNAEAFPAGFTSAPAACLPGRPTETLAAVLPQEAAVWFQPDLPPNTVRLRADGGVEPGGKPTPLTLPFSRERQWSVVILDEGAQEPQVGHFKFAWSIDTAAFRSWAMERGPRPEQLTEAKLQRLMKRLGHRPHATASIRPQGAAGDQPICLLDYPEAERADVLAGLRDFARDDACALRLAEVYGRIPAELRLLGPALGVAADAVRASIPAR